MNYKFCNEMWDEEEDSKKSSNNKDYQLTDLNHVPTGTKNYNFFKEMWDQEDDSEISSNNKDDHLTDLNHVPADTKSIEKLNYRVNKTTDNRANPSNQKEIVVATSIAPKRTKIQRMAIDTWLKAGFKVVSLNTEKEAKKLKKDFPDIEFHIVERSTIETYGKPYVYIDDFMHFLSNTDHRVCGIINSDIHLRGVQNNFIDRIYEEALNSLVYGHRVDVHDINDLHGTVSNGVDYFFFDKNLIDIYEDDGLCMGQPAWDWWMVCVAAAARKRIKRVLSPIVYHEIHPQQWYESLNQYLIESIVFEKYLKRLYPHASNQELNAKMWDIVISRDGIKFEVNAPNYQNSPKDNKNEIMMNKGTEVTSNPSKRKKIVVATSIAPKRIQLQRMAIDTWLKAGFKVVSLNIQEEVEMLKQDFPDIEFHIVKRSAKEEYGKPYIYIDDFMRFLSNTDYKVCGIINSDIHFKGIKDDFINRIYEEALGSLVYGHRVDVHNINDSNGTVSNGVDYFFFDKNLIKIYKDNGLCMGQPAWDWWMVCVAAAAKKQTKRILNQIAYHEIHPQEWYESLNQYLIESIVFEMYLKKLYPNASKYELNAKMWDIVISKSGIVI